MPTVASDGCAADTAAGGGSGADSGGSDAAQFLQREGCSRGDQAAGGSPPSSRGVREAGIRLELSDETIATASVFFHRFFSPRSGHSAERFKPTLIKMACLFLSAKASEQQRKARDVINVFHAIESGDIPTPLPARYVVCPPCVSLQGGGAIYPQPSL
jgi:hypothetical protein